MRNSKIPQSVTSNRAVDIRYLVRWMPPSPVAICLPALVNIEWNQCAASFVNLSSLQLGSDAVPVAIHGSGEFL